MPKASKPLAKFDRAKAGMSAAEYAEPTDAEIVDRFRSLPGVPMALRPGMLRYADHGVEPGHFLCAVIDNDLTEAVGRADAESLAALRDIVRWFYNEAPGPCWGSVDRRLSWVAEHNEK